MKHSTADLDAEFGNSTKAGNDSANVSALRNEETYAWLLSEPFPTANETAFDVERSKLRVMAIVNHETLPNGGSTMNRQIFCNRAGDALESAGSSVRNGGLISMVTTVAIVVAAWSSM